ncbi:hypothetical protein V6N13_049068 [Hibiscus sabdariffa]
MNASLPNNAGFFYVPQGYNDAPMFSRNTIQPSSFYSHAPMFASASFAPMYTHASGGASSLQIVSPVIPVYAPSAIHVCAPVCSGFSAQAHLATPEVCFSFCISISYYCICYRLWFAYITITITNS